MALELVDATDDGASSSRNIVHAVEKVESTRGDVTGLHRRELGLLGASFCTWRKALLDLERTGLTFAVTGKEGE